MYCWTFGSSTFSGVANVPEQLVNTARSAYLAHLMAPLLEFCMMLAIGVACSLPVMAMLNRHTASSLTYGLAGFGLAFYVVTLLLGPVLMHGTDSFVLFGGYGLMALSVCLLGASLQC